MTLALGRTFESALAAGASAGESDEDTSHPLGADVTNPNAARLARRADDPDGAPALRPATIDEVEALTRRCVRYVAPAVEGGGRGGEGGGGGGGLGAYLTRWEAGV